VQVRRDRRETEVQFLDQRVADVQRDLVHQAVAGHDAAAAEPCVDQAPDFTLGQRADPVVERLQAVARTSRGNQRTDRRAHDHVGLDALLAQRVQHADVRPATRRTAAEREAEQRSAHGCSARYRNGRLTSIL